MTGFYRCAKFGVLNASFMFMTIGAILVGYSLITLLEEKVSPEGSQKDPYQIYDACFMETVGAIIFVGGGLGLHGITKHSPYYIAAFLSIYLITFAVELGSTVHVFQNKGDDILKHLNTQMSDSLKNNYGVNEYHTRGWDLLQQSMHCCGTNGFRDYHMNVLQRPNSTESNLRNPSYLVPKSCCYNDLSETHCNASRNITFSGIHKNNADFTIYEQGCSDKLVEWSTKMRSGFILFFLGLGIGQVLHIICIIFLMHVYRSRCSSYSK